MPKTFRSAALETIDQANAIFDEYAAQGFTLTLRQLFYQFVSRGLIADGTLLGSTGGPQYSNDRNSSLSNLISGHPPPFLARVAHDRPRTQSR